MITDRQREATARFHERMAEQFDRIGRTADAEAARRAADAARAAKGAEG